MGFDLVQYLAIAAAAVFLFWLPSRIQVHWSAKDGRRCICQGQLRDAIGVAQTPWREYRLEVAPDGDVIAYRRSVLGGRRGGAWRVTGRGAGASGGKAEFLLQPRYESAEASVLAVRLPAGSRSVAVLDGLAQPAGPES
jgi:hypothetical protein